MKQIFDQENKSKMLLTRPPMLIPFTGYARPFMTLTITMIELIYMLSEMMTQETNIGIN